ncbi:unnamed protein product, partial [marine sediment metagenome]
MSMKKFLVYFMILSVFIGCSESAEELIKDLESNNDTTRRRAGTALIQGRGENGELFKDSELDYISTALGHITFALNNAQLIRELQDSYDELKEMQ